jgi:hypothetical protein
MCNTFRAEMPVPLVLARTMRAWGNVRSYLHNAAENAGEGTQRVQRYLQTGKVTLTVYRPGKNRSQFTDREITSHPDIYPYWQVINGMLYQ